MNERNVLILGPVSSGKSWFSNRIFGKQEFKEALQFGPCTRGVETRSKRLRDDVNQIECLLTLYDTPGGDPAAFVDSLQHVHFHQVALVVSIAQSVDNIDAYLNKFRKVFQASIRNWPSSITLVINKIGSSISDGYLVQFYEQLRSLLRLTGNEAICIRMGESVQDGWFKYLSHTDEDGYVFQTKNFLDALSHSQPIQHFAVSSESLPVPQAKQAKSGSSKGQASGFKSTTTSKSSSGSKAAKVEEKNVIVVGTVGSGKSWLLNKIYGQLVFPESDHFAACTRRIEFTSMTFPGLPRCQVNLYDSPGFGNTFETRHEGFERILAVLKKCDFVKLVLVTELVLPLGDELKKYLRALGKCAQTPRSIALVVNRVPAKSTTGQLVEHARAVRACLGVEIDEYIRISEGDLSADGLFKYFDIESRNGPLQFELKSFFDTLA